MTQPTPAVPSTAQPPAPPTTPTLTGRLRSLRDALLVGLVERDVAIRLALLGALAGEHLLLLGPPGTAKSLVASRLRLAFENATWFERLLTKFSVPEELFGPLSVSALEQDRYERITEGYLPTASVAFLDEIFKANSAILNALLTLLNERQFDNGAERVRTPLIAVVGASNEVPDEQDGLEALFDRFLLRLHVGPVTKESFRQLIGLRGDTLPTVPEALRLGPDDLIEVQRAATEVRVPPDVEALLYELREWCAGQQIAVSDRRWRKVVKLLQVSALTNGHDEVSVWDCWLLQHCLGDKHEHRKAVYDWYASRVGASAAMDPSRITKVVVSWEARLEADRQSRSRRRDERSGGVDRSNYGNGYAAAELDERGVHRRPGPYHGTSFLKGSDRPAHLADSTSRRPTGADLPAVMEPTRHEDLYVEGCLREVDRVHADVTLYRSRLVDHIASMESHIRTHLWVTADLIGPAGRALGQTMRDVEALEVRIQGVRKGFEMLPRERVPAAEGSAASDEGDADPAATTAKKTRKR